MANTILFKRGPEATIPVAQGGEILFTTDTKKYIVGDGTVNHDMVIADYTQALTNKTINASSNTITNLTDSSISLTAAIAATKIANTPTGNLAAINVQAALDELQSDVDSRIPLAQRGAALGVATLDAGSKIPSAQLPNSVMDYMGNFNALTNTPDLSALTPNNGDVYRVSVAGSQAYIEASIPLAVGDFVIFNGTIWEKSINSNEVVTVNGYKGVVVLASSDIGYNNTISGLTATNVKTALDELDGVLDGHLVDAIDAHDASAISTNSVAFTGILGASEDEVQKALVKLSTNSVIKITDDIPPTAFTILDGQLVAADVTGFYFNPATVRSFEALVSVSIDATIDLFESFKIHGLNTPTGFLVAIDSIGDDSGVWFDVTALGQVQYTSNVSAGFTSGKMSFRAIVTSI